MIIKNDKFELEISEGKSVYFGTKASGQLFKKWEECEDDEKRGIENIQREAEELLKRSEEIFFKRP